MDSTKPVSLSILRHLFIVVGSTVDVVAGIAMLGNYMVEGFALHFAALLIWTVGLTCPGGPGSLRDGRFTVAIVLGALLFPGLGTLGYAFGFGFAHFLGRHRQQAAKFEEEFFLSSDRLTEIHATVSTPPHSLVEIETQPLREILAKPDRDAKRAALNLICREPGARALSLVRTLLADPDSDVRTLAAVAVSRLESHFNELLRAVLARQESQPEVAGHHAETGYLYYQYAQAEPTNSANRRLYLVQARKSFEKAVSLEQSRYDYLISLAEVLTDLGEAPQAGGISARITAADPKNSTGYLLGMEVAFRQRRFDEVIVLAQRACQVIAEDDEVLPMMKWWSGFSPSNTPGSHDD
jgi:hypothetical protein